MPRASRCTSLQREQCADGVTPTLRAVASIGRAARTLRAVASIGRAARSGDGRGRIHLLARAIAGLAPFLKEGAGDKLLLVPNVTLLGHSLLFAVGAWPPQDGIRRTRCLNLSRDLEASLPAGSGLSTRSPRPSSPQERRGFALVGRKLERRLRCDRGRCGLLAPAELAAIDPHTVQDHRQLAGDRDTGTCHAPAFGDVHAPGT